MAEGSVGGLQNVVKPGQTVLIKINTVIPSDPDAGFTTDPRLLEALIELLADLDLGRVLLGEEFDDGNSFLFLADGHRIPDDATTWVGRGWVRAHDADGHQVAGKPQDWLFRAQMIPLPTGGAMAAAGLFGLACIRRRRA